MNSEQQEYQENLWSIQKKHLQEIDNKWKGPIKEWTNRYKSITGKLPDIERTDWGSYCFAHRYHNDNFNSYLKRLISE